MYTRPLDNPAAAVPGGENWLVLHRSEGADGSPVATSGIIALPDRAAHPVPAGGYPATPNPDQQKLDRQLEAMNPDLPLTVPVRITQAADDERVRADPAPLRGTDALVGELTATNSERGNIHYRRYEPGTVPADEPLGIHFATIGHDTPELTEWLAALLTAAGPRG